MGYDTADDDGGGGGGDKKIIIHFVCTEKFANICLSIFTKCLHREFKLFIKISQ